jgi:predicted MFS family arabinose efflux permease
LLLFAITNTYPLIILGRVLMGAGSGSVLMGALRTLSNWYDQREFGRVSGFIIAAGNLGNIAGTSPFARACETVGWRASFLVVLVLQGVALLSLLLVRESPSPRPMKPFTLHGVLTPFRTVWSTPLSRRLALIAFFWYATYMSVQGLWGGPYLRDAAGLSPGDAARALLCSSTGFLAGSLVVGKGAEWLGSPGRVMLAGESALLLMMLYFLIPAHLVPDGVVPVIFFLIGLFVASGVAIYPLIRERFPGEMIGTALTSVNLFILLGAATMQQLMGGVIERFRTAGGGYPESAYHVAFLIPVVGLFGALMLFRRTIRGSEVTG